MQKQKRLKRFKRYLAAAIFTLAGVLFISTNPSYAAVAYRSSGTFTAGTGTIAPPYPGDMAANDVCLLAVESENQAITLTTAQGFAEVPTWSPQSAGTAATDPGSRLALFWKRTAGGDTAPTVTDSGNHTTGQIHCFSGVVTSGNPWDIGAGGNDSAANDTSGNIPGATTTVDGAMVAIFTSTSYNATSTTQCSSWANADLSGLTERADNTNTAGLGGGHCMATGTKLSAGAYTTTTVTLANTSYKGAISLALSPTTVTISGSCDAYNRTTDCTDDGSNEVRIAVNGALQAATAAKDTTVDGAWSATISQPATNDIVTVFVNTPGTNAKRAGAVTKYGGSGNIASVALYEEHMVIGSDQNNTISNTNIDTYDYDQDADIPYQVSGGALTVDNAAQSSQEILYVQTGDTFTPGGAVNTLNFENVGSTDLGSNTMTLSGTGTPFTNSGTFTYSTSTVRYTGNGATITALAGNGGVNGYYNLEAKPSSSTPQVLGESSSLTIRANNNFVVGDGTNAGASATTNNPFILVGGVFTIAANASFAPGTNRVTLYGSGTPFVLTGTISGSLLAEYTGTSATNITATTYGELYLIPAGTPVYTLGTAGSQTITTGLLTIGNGTNGVQVNHATWDPAMIISNFTIAANAGTFTKSDAAAVITFKPKGSMVWTDNTATPQDIGVVVIGTGLSTPILTLGSSVRATSVNINASHEFDLSSYTLTLTGSGTPFVVGGTFTPSTSTVAYTSTSATNITSTTYNHLSLIPAGTPTYTLGTAVSQTINVNNLTIGNGSNGVAVNHATWDPALNISGNFTIAASAGTFTKSDSPATITLKPTGSKTWGDSSSTTQDVGVVVIGSGSSTPKITLSAGVKATSISVSASHELDASSRTLTLTGTGTPFANSGTYTYGTSTFVYTGNGANIAAVNMSNSSGGSNGYYNLELKPSSSTAQILGTAASQTIGVANNLTIGNGTNAGASGATNNPVLNVGGSITIAAAATYTTGTGTITVSGAGSYMLSRAAASSVFTATAGNTVVLAGTGPSQIFGTYETFINANAFYNLTVNGSGTFITSDKEIHVLNDLTVLSGTLTDSGSGGDITVGSTSISGSGDVRVASGATLSPRGLWQDTISGGSICIGSTGTTCSDTTAGTITATTWRLNDSATAAHTVSIGGSGTTISTAQIISGGVGLTTFNAGSATVILTGSYGVPSPFYGAGYLAAFNAGTSTFRFTNTADFVVAGVTYNNLEIQPGANSVTASFEQDSDTLSGTGTFVTGNLVIGDGTGNNTRVVSANIQADTNLDVDGNITINANTTFVANATNPLTFGGNWTNNGTFTHSSGTVTLNADGTPTSKTIDGSASTTFGTLTINAGTDTFTLGVNTTVATALNITNGTLNQGASYNLTTGTVTVASGGIWTNTGTGDVRLSGNVSNAGTITLDSGGGGQCAGSMSDDIVLDDAGTTQRTWSGAGTFNLYDLNVSDMAGSMTTYSSTNTTNNTGWTFTACGITIGGTIYQNDGSTVYNCSSNNLTVDIRVNGGGSYTGTCTASGGTYSISNVTVSATNDVITTFINDETPRGVTVTKAGNNSSDITDLHIYENRVTVRTETGASAMTNTDMDAFDDGSAFGTGDGDVLFGVTSGNMTVGGSHMLFIFDNGTTTTNFTPGGTVGTYSSNDGTNSVVDGDLTIQAGATLAMGTNALSVGGDFTNSGTFSYSGGQTTTFTAISTGFDIEDGTANFDNLIFNGSGGGWSLTSAVVLAGDLTMTAGTLSGTSSLTVNGGDATGNGTINLTGGTFTIDGAGNFGGDTGWTFASLNFGDGSGTTTTTATGTGGVTVSSVMTIAANQTLSAGSKTYTLSGTGTPFVATGVFNGTSAIFRYTGNGATIASTDNNSDGSIAYHILEAQPGGATAQTIGTASGHTISVSNVFTVGDGSNAGATGATHNPTVTALYLEVRNGATYTTGTGTITVTGCANNSFDRKASGVFTATAGNTVTFTCANTSGLSNIISRAMTGSNAFYNLTIDGDGGGDSFAMGYDFTVTNDLTVSTGDIMTSAQNVIVNGVVGGDGTITHSANTFTHDTTTSKNFGGATNWSFYNLTVSGASGTTAANGAGSITVNGTLDLGASHTLNAGSKTWIMMATGGPITGSGSITFSTSTFSYRNTTSASTLSNITYYNLDFSPASGTPTYTVANGANLSVGGNLTIGGAGNAIVDAGNVASYLSVAGNVVIGTGDTLQGPSNATFLYVTGSWTNSGTYTHNSGTVSFDANTTGKTITSGGSNFHNLTFNHASGGWTLQDATTVANNLTITAGTLTMGNAAFTVTGTSSITGTLNTSTGATGTRTFTGGVTINSGGVWDLSGQNPATSFNGGITMNGTTFNNGTGTTTFTASQVFDGTSAMTFGGATTINSGFVLTNRVTTSTVTFNNTITGGNGSSSFAAGSGSYSKFANTVMSTGILTPAAGANTFEYSQAGAQTVKVPTTNNYYHLILSGSGAKTMTSITTIAGNFTMNGSVTATPVITTISGNLAVNGTAGLTLGANLVVTGTSAIGDGSAATFNQGATYNFTSGAVTVAANGTWTNTGTGDVTLSGNVSNAGAITLNSNAGSQCVDGADDIVVDSTVDNTTRSWSGAGTFTLYNLNVDDMTGSVTVYTSTVSGDTTWTVGSCGITISGTLYQNDGTTVINCSGGGANTRTVDIRVNGAGSYTGDCTAAGGTFSISSVTIGAQNDVITVFLNGETEKAVTVTKAKDTSTNITDMNLYTNRMTVRTETTASAMTNTNLNQFDNACNSGTGDTDIPFCVDGGNLTVSDGSMLLVFDNATTTTALTPGGTVTTDPSSSGTDSVVDGDLTIQSGATLDMGTNALSVGGDFTNSGTFSYGSQTTTFTATSTGFDIEDGTANFSSLTFNGSGGGWTLSSDVTVSNVLTITAGNLNASSRTITLSGTTTPFVNNGTFTPSTSTVVYTGAAAMNVAATTYHNLEVKPAANSVAPKLGTAGSQTITVNGNLVLGNGTNTGVVVNATLYDPTIDVNGDVTVNANTTFNMCDSCTFTVGGSWDSTNGILTHNNGTVIFDAGATGKTIETSTWPNGVFKNVTFNNSSGGWSNTNELDAEGNFTMTAGTYSGSGAVIVSGNVSGNGVINKSGSGRFQLPDNGSTFGGDTDWTFSILRFGDTINTESTSVTGTGTITVTSELQIASSHTLNAGSKTWILSGSGTPFPIVTWAGTFNAQTSTVQYTSTSATNISPRTYNNLSLIPAGTPVYTLGTAGSQTINVDGNFLIGNGTDGVQVNHATWDPALNIAGNFTIAANAGTFTKSDSPATITLKPTGAKIWTNNANQDDFGVIVIGSGTSTPKITLGSNIKASSVTINASHEFDLSSYTLTLTNSGAPFSVSGTFTPSTGTVKYNGTSATTIAGTTYYGLDAGVFAGSANTYTLGGNTTVGSVLSIGANSGIGVHGLDASTYTLTLSGSGTPMVIGTQGSFTASTSTVQYTGTSATNIIATTYNHLSLIPAGTPTYTLGTAGSQTINTNNFTIGNGTNAVAVNHATWDPALNIAGNFTISANAGTFTKSDSPATITLNPTGSKTWGDSSSTTQDVGVVVIGSGTSTPKITLSAGVRATSVTVNASHEFDLSSRTLTLTGSGTPLSISGTFTPSTSTVLYAGTTATNIAPTTYNNLTIDRASGTPTFSMTGTTIVNANLNITNGTFSQGASYNLTTGDVTVAANGTWTNTGTGDVTLSGNVSNAGAITLNSNAGSQCVDGADDIVVDSTVNNTTRSWSGAGTFTLYNLNVDDMTGSVTVYTSTVSGDTTWTVGSCGITISGTSNSAGTVKVAVNTTLQGQTSTISGGNFSITGMTAPSSGDVITVFIDTATTGDQATAITKYTSGNITSLVLNRHILAVGHGSQSLSIANLGQYDHDQNSNIMHTANSGVLLTDSAGAYTDEVLNILTGGTLTVGDTDLLTTQDMTINGTLATTGNAEYTVSGSWVNNGTFTAGTSTVSFTAPSGTPTLSGTLNGSSAFYQVNFDTGSSGTAVWTIQNPMKVSSPDILGVFNISYGTVTLGNGGGDHLELRGGMTIAANVGETGVFQTMSGLAQGDATDCNGDDICIDMNANTSTPTCDNCKILVGAASGGGQGTFRLRKNTLLRLNPRSTATASNTGLIVESTGYLDVQGSQDATGTSNGTTDETTLTDTGKSWTTNEHTNKVVRMTSGLAIGRIYSISSNTATTLTHTDTEITLGSIVSISGTAPEPTRTVCVSKDNYINTDNEGVGRYLHDKTGTTGYLKIVGSTHIDSNCSDQNSFKVIAEPDALSILSASDTIAISDGVKQNDGYEILDYAAISAEAGTACSAVINEAGESYIYAKSGSESLVRYADICNLGHNDAYETVGFVAEGVNGANSNEGLTVDKSRLRNMYVNIDFLGSNNNSTANSKGLTNNDISGTNAGDGDIILDGAAGNTVSGNRIHGVGVGNDGAINLSNGSTGNTISSNYIYENGDPNTGGNPTLGINLNAATGNTISSNHIFNNQGEAMAVYSSSTGNTISSNVIYSEYITLGSASNTISSNQIYSTGYGIFLFNGAANNSVITGNTMYDLSSAAISFYEPANNVRIASNTIYYVYEGIGINGENNLAYSNQIHDITNFGIGLSGGKSTLFSNTIYNAGSGVDINSNSTVDLTSFGNQIYSNGGGVDIYGTGAGRMDFINDDFGGSGDNSGSDIFVAAGATRSVSLFNTILASPTELNMAATASYMITRKHDGTAGAVKTWGPYSVPAANAETPQSEETAAFNYANNLWEKSASPHYYYGTGGEDTNLNYDLSGATLSGGPYNYFVVVKTAGGCGSAVFDVFRNGVDVGDANCGAQFTDTNGSVNVKFTVDGGSPSYVVGDAYTFSVWNASGDTNTDKSFTVMQDGDSITIPSGSTLQFDGASGHLSTLTPSTGTFAMTINGTLSGGYNDLTVGRNVAGTGTVSMTTGSIFRHRVDAARNFGTTSGSNTWTFQDLSFENSSGSARTVTTNSGGTGAIVTNGTLSIGKATDAQNTTLQNETNDRILDANGSVDITSKGVLNASSTASFTVGSNWTNSNTFTSNTGTVTFDATSTGKTLSGTLNGASAFNNLVFNGSGGDWSNDSAMLVSGDLTVTAGTLSGTNNITVNGGDVTGNGTINLTGGTFLVDTAGNFGGDTGWTFSSLTFGDGTGTTTTTATGTGSITATSVLTIAANQTLSAASKTYTLSGTGTPFVKTGTFTPSTSTVVYTGAGATNITAATYNNLEVKPGADSATHTLLGLDVNGNFVAGNGTNTGVTVTEAGYDGSFDVDGNVTINANTTLVNNDFYGMSVGGNWTNNGLFTPSGYGVSFDGTGTQTLAGSTTFYGLYITASTARTVNFTAGTTQNIDINGSLTLTGASGQLLTLASTTPGTQWNLQADNAIASQNIQYVNVSDCNAGPFGTYAEMVAADGTSTDGGNNDNWDFGNKAQGFLTYF